MGWKINGFGARVLNNEAVVNYWSVPASGSLLAADLLKKTEVVVVTFALATGVTNIEINDFTIEAYKGEDGASVIARAVELGYLTTEAAGTITPFGEIGATTNLSAVELTAADTFFVKIV